MRLSAIDIKKQEFKKSMRGYDVGEVEAFMDLAANEVENLNKENETLKEHITKLNEDIKELKEEVDVFKENEKTFQKAIVKSQDMSEDVLENAKKRAELIVKEAEIMSSKIKVTTQEDFVNLKQELEELRQKNEIIIDDIKNFLVDKLNSIEEYSRNRKILRLESNMTTISNLNAEKEEEHINKQFPMDINLNADDSNR
jgi:cell division initiation protein